MLKVKRRKGKIVWTVEHTNATHIFVKRMIPRGYQHKIIERRVYDDDWIAVRSK